MKLAKAIKKILLMCLAAIIFESISRVSVNAQRESCYPINTRIAKKCLEIYYESTPELCDSNYKGNYYGITNYANSFMSNPNWTFQSIFYKRSDGSIDKKRYLTDVYVQKKVADYIFINDGYPESIIVGIEKYLGKFDYRKSRAYLFFPDAKCMLINENLYKGINVKSWKICDILRLILYYDNILPSLCGESEIPIEVYFNKACAYKLIEENFEFISNQVIEQKICQVGDAEKLKAFQDTILKYNFPEE